MPYIVKNLQIPDPARPIPPENRGLGPSGALVDFAPTPISGGDVVGRRVDEVCDHVGTYGMGGPGFFGLRLGHQWLVVAVWGAGEWITAKGRRVEDHSHETDGRPRPWLDCSNEERGDDLSPSLVGAQITRLAVGRHEMQMEFSNGFDLTITGAIPGAQVLREEFRPSLSEAVTGEELRRRASLPGALEPKQLGPEDDLREAVFLSPTTELWC